MGKYDFKDVKSISEFLDSQKPPIRNNFTFHQYSEEVLPLLKKNMMRDLPKHLISYKQ